MIPTLAFETPEGLVGPPTSPHPALILNVLAVARPAKIHNIGVVYGPRSRRWWRRRRAPPSGSG